MKFKSDKNWWSVVNEHLVIRETVGYDLIGQIELEDAPQVLDFLQIIWNYEKMFKLLAEENLT